VRNNLVIVRAGDSSLHEGWLEGGDRNWDLIVSYFGDEPGRYETEGTLVIRSKGAKWPPLGEVIEDLNSSGELDKYDYICLPDDDLRGTTLAFNTLFEYCARYRLALAQPALALGSYYSWPITRQHRSSSLRWVNIVEAMAPTFRRDLLRKVYPEFRTTLSGWGHDAWWAAEVEEPDREIAIIDAAAVVHTRPVGGPNHTRVREAGLTPEKELKEFLQRKGLEFPVPKTYGYVDIRENPVRHMRVLEESANDDGHQLSLWVDSTG